MAYANTMQEASLGSVFQGSVGPDLVRSLHDVYPVDDTVIVEVETLQSRGFDVVFTDQNDPYRRSHNVEQRVGQVVASLEQKQLEEGTGARIFRDPTLFPAIGTWAKLIMSAEALQPLYTAGEAVTLGGGIQPDAYDVPLFTPANTSLFPESAEGALTAKDLCRADNARRPERAERQIANHVEFVTTPIDPSSRVLFEAAHDGMGIRERAEAFEQLAMQRLEQSPNGLFLNNNIRIASLGCGAAYPVLKLAKKVSEAGGAVSELALVDWDPLALASAVSLADVHGMRGIINIQRRNLKDENTYAHLEEDGKFDIVDLLGVEEYFTNTDNANPAKHHEAAQLLARARQLVKPGGTIIFGNMLNNRPQQVFFNQVIQWPGLQQRSVEETLRIIEEAGFDPHDVSVRIPAGSGIYAVYAIKVPDGQSSTMPDAA